MTYSQQHHNYASLEIYLCQIDSSDDYTIELSHSVASSGLKPDVLPRFKIQFDYEQLLEAMVDIEKYGMMLWDILFSHAQLREYFLFARRNAQSADIPLRVGLRLSSDDERLHALAWESLRNPENGDILFADERFIFSRWVERVDDRTPLVLRALDKLHTIIAIASPQDLHDYNLKPVEFSADAEWIDELRAVSRVTLISQRHSKKTASLSNIIMEADYDSAILCLVCHGKIEDGKSFLFLENEDGNTERVLAEEFVRLLNGRSRRPSLVLLLSCSSAGTVLGDGLIAAGPTLARTGIPAVIAIQGQLPMNVANRALQNFFRKLLKHNADVDLAVAAARAAILNEPNWWSIILFSIIRDGKIWKTPDSKMRDRQQELQERLSELTPREYHASVPIIAEGIVRITSDQSALDSFQAIFEQRKHEQALQAVLALRDKVVETKHFRVSVEPGERFFALRVQELESGRQEVVEIKYPPCPYLGMVSYSREDAHLFFGRNRELETIRQRLGKHKRVFIIGASGSGKSSLLLAGVQPRLRGWGLGQGDVIVLRPGSKPFQSLMTELTRRHFGDHSRETILNPDLLLDKYKKEDNRSLFLIFDQFEELFTVAERIERERFLTTVQKLAALPACRMVIAVRADFFGDMTRTEIGPIPEAQRVRLEPLGGKALIEALVEPAKRLHVKLDSRLVETILKDASHEPGALPPIQETMVRLWEKVNAREIALGAYQELEDVSDSGNVLAAALAVQAEATFESFDDEEQLVTQRIFLRLVQFGEGRADTRRQQLVDDLLSTASSSVQFNRVLQKLVEDRLLTVGNSSSHFARSVDLAHEALISGWPRLNQWVKERRDYEQLRRKFEMKTREWHRLGGKLDGLMSEKELLEAQDWLNKKEVRELGVASSIEDYVAVSSEAQQKIRQERLALDAIREANRRLAILWQANTILMAAEDYVIALRDTASLLIKEFAEWCSIALEENQEMRAIAVAHRDDSEGVMAVARLPIRQLSPQPEVVLVNLGLRSIRTVGENFHFITQGSEELAVMAPLTAGEQTIGLIILAPADQEGKIPEESLSFIRALADRLALCVESIKLHRNMRRKIQEQEILLEAARVMNSQMAIDKVYDCLLALVQRHFSADRVELWIKSANDTWVLALQRSTNQSPIDSYRYQMSPIVANAINFKKHEVTGNEVAIPLIGNKQIIGVLYFNTRANELFTTEAIALLKGLADIAAAACEKTKLHEELKISEERRANQRVASVVRLGVDRQRFIDTKITAIQGNTSGIKHRLLEYFPKSTEVEQIVARLERIAAISGVIRSKLIGNDVPLISNLPEQLISIDDTLEEFRQILATRRSDMSINLTCGCRDINAKISREGFEFILEKLILGAVLEMPPAGKLTLETRNKTTSIELRISEAKAFIPEIMWSYLLSPHITDIEITSRRHTDILVAHHIIIGFGGTMQLFRQESDNSTELVVSFPAVIPGIDVVQSGLSASE